ncbi:MAG TPA: hypothetical protein VLK25_09235 [Allosphingosinicella sp.]|nr:hypothetical protein [Allosphingosinicella sp.]
MVRKFVAATVSAALCFAALAPGVATAQDYRFAGFDAPRGAVATLNLRVPLGSERQARERLSYGLTLGYGAVAGGPALDGTTITRQVRVADLRFDRHGEVRNARVAGLDLANLDRDRRASNLTGEMSTVWIVIGIVAVGAGVCLLADCFDSEEATPAT